MNRLGVETSPYLLQHAENPVDWYPWGAEAFALAKSQDKPVLLSVGYSACHWCHVMEHESFEDRETASLMNERFVSIKVDREERPDVDGLYMEAVVAMTGQGGWPMTVFLTPDGRPFYGGTYYPPEPRMGMPSFRQVLLAVDQAYREKRGDLEQQADAIVDALRQGATQSPSHEPLTTGLLTAAVVGLRRQFDSTHGGFGAAPKFPPASSLEFLLRMHHQSEAEDTLEMVRLTLDRMAAGGMYDQLGGGFHRYSVDAVWLVPHFEKMLYDNALLASAYLHGWTVTGEDDYRRIVEETLDYLVREMRLPEGGFASAQDADTEGEEGLTYTWTEAEIRQLLAEPAAEAVIGRFGVTPQGNFEGRSILYVAAPTVEVEPNVLQTLLEARAKRPQPFRDDKVLSGWNGLVLAALAEAGRRLDRADYIAAAADLAEFLLGPLSDDRGRVLRTYRNGEAKIAGYLEDYANVANGLLELYFATGAVRWLEEARRLAEIALEHFGDADHGGFFVSPADGEELVARRKEFDDHPTPSGNSMIAYVLIRLARIFGEPEYDRSAVGVFRVSHALIERAPSALGHMLSALDLHFSPPREVALIGASPELREAALEGFEPNTVYAFAAGSDDPALERIPLLTGKTLVDGRPAAYVCQSFACQAPVTEPDELRRALSAAPG